MTAGGKVMTQELVKTVLRVLHEHAKDCTFAPGVEAAVEAAAREAGQRIGELIDAYEIECSLKHAEGG